MIDENQINFNHNQYSYTIHLKLVVVQINRIPTIYVQINRIPTPNAFIAPQIIICRTIINTTNNYLCGL